MKQPEKILDLFVDGILVGHLYDTRPMSLSYSSAALDGRIAIPFADIIPIKDGIISDAVEAFFENLLPEGDQRLLLESRHHVSTVFGMLSEVGGDTAGSVVILRHGYAPQRNEYLPASWQSLKMMLSSGIPPEGMSDEGTSMSGHVTISGAQNKLLLSLDDKGIPLIPLGASISTCILKPDIIRPGLKVWCSAINETLIMQAAKLCELPVAEVAYIGEAQACLVKRYDRLEHPDKTVSRLYQADLCQMLGVASSVKYENDGGPSFKDCYNLVRSKSVAPAIDCRNLLRWMMFNLYVGNNDSHGKNISMIGTPNGLRLAPFYDLMCTRVYAGLPSNFAFKIGNNFQSDKISCDDLALLSAEIGVKPGYLMEIAREMAGKIEEVIPVAVADLTENLGYTEKVVAERMVHLIRGVVKKTSARLLLADAISTDALNHGLKN